MTDVATFAAIVIAITRIYDHGVPCMFEQPSHVSFVNDIIHQMEDYVERHRRIENRILWQFFHEMEIAVLPSGIQLPAVRDRVRRDVKSEVVRHFEKRVLISIAATKLNDGINIPLVDVVIDYLRLEFSEATVRALSGIATGSIACLPICYAVDIFASRTVSHWVASTITQYTRALGSMYLISLVSVLVCTGRSSRRTVFLASSAKASVCFIQF